MCYNHSDIVAGIPVDLSKPDITIPALPPVLTHAIDNESKIPYGPAPSLVLSSLVNTFNKSASAYGTGGGIVGDNPSLIGPKPDGKAGGSSDISMATR